MSHKRCPYITQHFSVKTTQIRTPIDFHLLPFMAQVFQHTSPKTTGKDMMFSSAWEENKIKMTFTVNHLLSNIPIDVLPWENSLKSFLIISHQHILLLMRLKSILFSSELFAIQSNIPRRFRSCLLPISKNSSPSDTLAHW